MLTNKLVVNALLKKHIPITFTPVAHSSASGFLDGRASIGNREWVGYGLHGQANYADKLEYPAPAIRFKEIKGDLVALREKEKGDWKKLTIEEKKELYRASFRQTLEEVYAPTGDWKLAIGYTLVAVSVSFWVYLFIQKYIVRPLPPSFSEEYRARNVRELIDTKFGHLTGISSKWDYEKHDWKK